MLSKKRRRTEPPSIHPRNRYSEKSPDFALLASLYPSFHPFVFSSSAAARPTIDWTDFNATRELTRVLLLHDHALHWWIPDGQLCPTVPNRLNYIHWVEDLLSSELIPRPSGSDAKIRGFDIGIGANCIYPLLGTSLLGWSFVGSDVADVALEWARKNVESNPHLSELIEIRDARDLSRSGISQLCQEGADTKEDVEPATSLRSLNGGMSVLVGVVREGEYFDFCMCNPPFFESMEEAGLNPKTSCGGTCAEMVCPGGEQAFIVKIIEDSVVLKHSFRWFTTMVGRKTNLKFLEKKLREVGVSIVKTTEFVQGRTARWGLAWSFVSPNKKYLAVSMPKKSNYSFTLEGLQRHFGAFQVLKSVESFFLEAGASCQCDFSSFCVTVTLSKQGDRTIPRNNSDKLNGHAISTSSEELNITLGIFEELFFNVSVFEQIPGTILVKGSLLHKHRPFSDMFSVLFFQLEEALKKDFLVKSHKHSRT